MAAVMEANAILFEASKAVDRPEAWGSWRQALHDRLSKIDATNPRGDNVTEISLGIGVNTLGKTV
jgi:hypothetical protein